MRGKHKQRKQQRAEQQLQRLQNRTHKDVYKHKPVEKHTYDKR